MPLTFSLPSSELDNKWIAPAYKSSHVFGANGADYYRLGELVQIDSGQYVRGYAVTGIPYYRVDNIRNLVTNETNGDVVFIDEDIATDVSDRCQCKELDVLIARTGTLGKASLATKYHAGAVLSQHATRLAITASDKITPGFLALYLSSPIGSEHLISMGSGSTRLELTHRDLQKVPVRKVPYERQEHFHDRLTDALERYYSSIDAIRLLNGEANRLLGIECEVTSGLSFSVPLADIDRIWFPKRYQEHIRAAHEQIRTQFDTELLGRICWVQRGKGTRSSDYVVTGIPFVRTSSLVNYSIDPFPDYYADESTYARYGQQINQDTILVSIEGKIGQIALVDPEHPVVVKNHVEMLGLEPSYSKNNDWIVGWMLAVLRSDFGLVQFEQNTVTQATIPGLASRLREFVLPLPRDDNREKVMKIGREYYKWNKQLLRCTSELRAVQHDVNSILETVD